MSEKHRIVSVILFVCDQCGYYRADRKTGVHQTTNPDDPSGAMVSHDLVPVIFQREEEDRDE